MTVTRELVLAVADWWEKQDGGDTNQPYADRLRSAAMWADQSHLACSMCAGTGVIRTLNQLSGQRVCDCRLAQAMGTQR